MLRAEHGARATEAGNHLIGDQQDIVFFENILYRRPVAFRRRRDAARAEHRFGNEGAYRVGTFAQDECFQFVGAAF